MSKKMILNITSRKLHDNMTTATTQSYGGTVTLGGSYLMANPPANDVTAQNVFMFPWIATARPSLTNNAYSDSDRSSQTCYMRGLKELCRLRLATTADEWSWRRICFTFRGPQINSIQTLFNYQTGANQGVYRYLYSPSNDINTGTNASLIQTTIYNFLFRGTFARDWYDPFIANLDSTRIDVKCDRTRQIKSGNQQPVERYIKYWHAMNKNLVYDDDEAGASLTSGNLSVNDKRGMGDFYVIDLFRCANVASTTAQLYYQPESTLYWHQKSA